MEQGQVRRDKSPAPSVQWRLNPEDTKQQIKNLLRGKKQFRRYDKKKKEYVTVEKDVGEALLNEEGVHGVMRELQRLSKTSLQANTDKTELHKFMRILHKHIACLIASNFDEWGVESIAAYHQIVNIVSDVTYLALTRTIDDLEREHNSQERSVVERFTDEGKSALNSLGFKE